ncbi:MAG: cytochrome b [Ilumatobacteraceae bacterium]
MRLSFEALSVRIRQIHHWAALLFVASIVLHMMRVFFTGAFRKPREINWVLGCTLLLLGLAMGFTGYSLPDDSLSGTGLRIADSVVLSIPVAGEWVSSLLFGGSWPSTIIVSRLFPIHVFVLPLALLGLIGGHLALVWRQKHTQFDGPGRTEDNVVGERVWPGFAMKSIGMLSLTAGTLAALGGFAQINPIWLYGPYDPAASSADAQPDWYIGWLEGALRLMPPLEIRAFGYTVPNPFFPGVLLPGLMFGALYGVPWIERRFTQDHRVHHLLDRPRDAPVRTAIGVAALSVVGVLLLAGAQDVIADTLSVPLATVRRLLQIGLLLVPAASGWFTFRLARSLARRDDPSVVEIRRGDSGGYAERPEASSR